MAISSSAGPRFASAIRMANPQRKRHLVACIFFIVAATGCAGTTAGTGGRDVWVPTGPEPVRVGNMTGTRYDLPSGSLTLSALPSRKGSGEYEDEKLLGIRMLVANDRDQHPWLVNVSEQALRTASKPEPPAAARTRPGTKVVAIPPGESETVDLYFPAPDQSEPEPGGAAQTLVFEWTLHAGDGALTERTPLVRGRLVPEMGLLSDRGEALGRLWYDPDWNQPTYNYPRQVVRWRTVILDPRP
jgi:hypothetical protein